MTRNKKKTEFLLVSLLCIVGRSLRCQVHDAIRFQGIAGADLAKAQQAFSRAVNPDWTWLCVGFDRVAVFEPRCGCFVQVNNGPGFQPRVDRE
jgi:hypothetical protein